MYLSHLIKSARVKKYIGWFFSGLACAAISCILLICLLQPIVNHYRPKLEDIVSEYLQVPVHIKSVKLGWHGCAPAILLRDITVLDPKALQPILTVQSAQLGVQILSSIWYHQVKLAHLFISTVTLSVSKDHLGKFSVNRIPIHNAVTFGKQDDFLQQLSWFSDLPSITLSHLKINFTVDKVTYGININKFKLLNSGDDHTLQAKFVIHQLSDKNIKLNILWKGKNFDYLHHKGQAYINFLDISLPELVARIQQIMPDIVSTRTISYGIGSGDVWLNWDQAKLQEINAKINLKKLAIHSLKPSAIYEFPQLTGNFQWSCQGEKQLFHGDNITLNFADNVWPVFSFGLIFGHKSLDDWRIQAIQMSYLHVQDTMKLLLASQLLSPELNKLMNNLQPKGELRNIQFLWNINSANWQPVLSSGEASDLSWKSYGKIPGVQHLSGNWRWHGGSGHIDLSSKQLSIAAQPTFAYPLNFINSRGTLLLRKQTNSWLITLSNLLLDNQDLRTTINLNLLIPASNRAYLDMQANFSVTQFENLSHYLPSNILQEKLRNWLTDAFLRGKLVAGKVELKSPLPLDQQKLLLRITGKLQDLDLRYDTNWPIVHIPDSLVEITGDKLLFEVNNAQSLDLELKDFKGDLLFGEHQDPTLNLKGNISSDLDHAVHFLQATPVAKIMLDEGWSAYQVTGPFNLSLGLKVPILAPNKFHLSSLLETTDASFALPTIGLNLDHIQGKVNLTEQSINASHVTGNLWGQETALNIATIPANKLKPSIITAIINGKLDIARFDQLLHLGVSNFASGMSNYKIVGNFAQNSNKNSAVSSSVVLTSDLSGIKISLPAPYGKKASKKLNFTTNIMFKNSTQYDFMVRYGELFSAKLKLLNLVGSKIVEILSDSVQGKITFKYPWSKVNPLNIELSKVALIDFAPHKSSVSSGIVPQQLPPINIRINNLWYKNSNIGQLLLKTVPADNGLEINQLTLLAPEYKFTADGSWQIRDGQHYSNLQGSIISHNLKKLVSRFGISINNLLIDKGLANFSLEWQDLLYKPSLKNITGNVYFYIDKGRVVNLSKSDTQKIDLGRIISLFSLQTIPRRLSLDFSDLLQKGYSFDFIKGDFVLRNGNAYIKKNIVLKSPVANIKTHGRIGIIDQDYDLVLSVEPQISASLPVVASALTLNPFVGAATWLVNKVVLDKELSKAVTYNYFISGPWTKPSWRELNERERKNM